MTVTAPARRERRWGHSPALRATVALVATVTVMVVGLAGLSASAASAQTLDRAETRVGASGLAAGQMVGAHPDIPAGQRRARAPDYDRTAVGSCVAAETETAAQDGVDLQLRYKAGWSPDQIAAADAKVEALNTAAGNGDLSVTQVERSGTSAASMFRSAGGEIPPGADVDHVLDLQLGGANDISNLNPLDYSVNRSLGAQIACQIRGVAVGTPIASVSICSG